MSELGWYLLTVRPGMEQAAAAAVKRLGWEVFLPGYRKVVLKHAHQRGGRRKPADAASAREERAFPSWPGYLWAGASDVRTGSPSCGWKRILALHLVTGVIMVRRRGDAGRIEGWPLQLPRNWRRHRQLRDAEDIAFVSAVAAPPGPDYDLGDTVIITMEAFHQWPGKCVFLDRENNIARAVIRMLGSDRAVTIPADAAVRSRFGPA